MSGQVLKVGDNIFKRSESRRLKGRDLYQSQSFLIEQQKAYREAVEARAKLSKSEVRWEEMSTVEDIQQMAKLEAAVSRSMFSVGIAISDLAHERVLVRALNNLDVNSIKCYSTASEAAASLSEHQMLFSSYEFDGGDVDGRELNDKVRDKNFNENYLTSHCLVSGYTKKQAVNLRSAGIDTFVHCLDDIESGIAYECLQSLTRGYYALHLVDVLYGKEKAAEVRARAAKLMMDLEALERAAAKNRFRILIVEDEKDLLEVMVDYVVDMGYTNIDVATSVEQAKAKISANCYDLIVSDYRLKDDSANKIYDHIQALKLPKKQIPEFVIVTGYKGGEVLHLRKYGIRIFDKVGFENIEDTVKGCYVRKIRMLLSEIL